MALILTLPVEPADPVGQVHQHIAYYLESDRDVTSYARSCKTIQACVNDSFWAGKFSEAFDSLPPGATIADISSEYKDRKCMGSFAVSFDDPEESPIHRACGQVLRDLILQSDARKSTDAKGSAVIFGRNLEFLRKFAGGSTQSLTNRSFSFIRHGTNILETLCKTLTKMDGLDYTTTSRTPKSFAHIIQLSLLHLVFDPDQCLSRPAVVNMSQEVVYRSQVLEPIFMGRRRDELNIYWLLHVVNHFKFHLKQRMEGILEHFYRSFAKNDLPRAWIGHLKNGTTELGKKWKGASMFLDETETATIRAANDRLEYAAGGIWVDQVCDGNDGFQDLLLFFDIEGHPQLQFPQHIEKYIKGKPRFPLRDYLTDKEYDPEVKDFFGLGYDGERYHLYGRVHALPPQQGIPGFQRVTMLKYMTYSSNTGDMLTKIWAYEGLVTPGNTFMAGRWWDLFGRRLRDRQPYCGPFIYWNVECTDQDAKDANIDVALEYLRSLEN